MSKAIQLWQKVCNLAGVDIGISILQKNALPKGAYTIKGDVIEWNGNANYPADVFAVARLAQVLFDAVMPKPDKIVLRKPISSLPDYIEYTPKISPFHIGNIIPNKLHTWYHWHHVPTEPMHVDLNKSWWVGLALKNPQLAPTTIQVFEHSKLNILHPKFAPLIHSNWVEMGKPEICSLYELDAHPTKWSLSRYWWMPEYFPAPKWMNVAEREHWNNTLMNGTSIIREVGREYRVNGVKYRYSQEAKDAIDSLPWASDRRLNYTSLYIQMYKSVEAYFHLQGDYPRFQFLAYATYYIAPEGFVDLRNFDVHYSTPASDDWTEETLLKDIDNFKKWQRTGANVIPRPNRLLKNPTIPNLLPKFIDAVKPTGLIAYMKYSININDEIYLIMQAMLDISHNSTTGAE